MIGSLHGPMDEENLNGCMAPLLAGCPGLNFNNDMLMDFCGEDQTLLDF